MPEAETYSVFSLHILHALQVSLVMSAIYNWFNIAGVFLQDQYGDLMGQPSSESFTYGMIYYARYYTRVVYVCCTLYFFCMQFFEWVAMLNIMHY
jgi:hypothetical protein